MKRLQAPFMLLTLSTLVTAFIITSAKIATEETLASKFSGDFNALIDRYVALCVKIEKQKGCKPDFTFVRRLSFTQPCIIRCYNAMVERKSIMPLRELWDAYKSNTLTCTGKKFTYELCNLIGLVFEQFILKLVTHITGQDVDLINALLAKIDSNIPFDELIDILEKCYSILLNVLNSEQPTRPPSFLKKRWVIATLTGALILYQLYKRLFGKPSGPVVYPSNFVVY